MNLNSSIVAGVGAGLGIVVAGLGTANGLSYEFAFKIEAGVLFLLWTVMMSLESKFLSINHAEEDSTTPPDPPDRPSSPASDRLLKSPPGSPSSPAPASS